MLFDLSPKFPFWFGSLIVLLSALIVFLFIKEPKEYDPAPKEDANSFSGFFEFHRDHILIFIIGFFVAAGLTILLGNAFPGLQMAGSQFGFPPYLIMAMILLFIWLVYLYVFYMAREVIFAEEKSGLRILLAIFFWFIGFSAVESFFTLYSVKQLGLTPGLGATLLSILPLFFVIFAIPSGFIAGRIGRRRTIMTGLMFIIFMMIALYLIPAKTLLQGIAPLPLIGIPLEQGGPRMLTVAGVLLSIGGIGWAFININSLPMIVDLTGAQKIGMYVGLYYLFSTLSAIFGPISNGIAIELTNNNYNIIMALGPIFFFAAWLLMFGVRRGEAKA
jgi:hypothetical protein